jgi:hypothetical protein
LASGILVSPHKDSGKGSRERGHIALRRRFRGFIAVQQPRMTNLL